MAAVPELYLGRDRVSRQLEYFANPVIVAVSDASDAPDSNTPPEGSLLPYISNRTASVHTSYCPPWESAQGAGRSVAVCSGFRCRSPCLCHARYPTRPYTSYTLFSAFASLNTKVADHDTTLRLNVKNLFDEEYQRYFLDYGSGMALGNYGEPQQETLFCNPTDGVTVVGIVSYGSRAVHRLLSGFVDCGRAASSIPGTHDSDKCRDEAVRFLGLGPCGSRWREDESEGWYHAPPLVVACGPP